jgi:type III secretion protein C
MVLKVEGKVKRALLGIVLALSSVLAHAHAAVSIPWNGPPYFITTRGAKVAEVLKGMGANYSIPVMVSPEVEDHFVGTIRNTPPDMILERFAQLFNLATYYDGQALYVYKTHEAKSQIITPRYLTTEKLVKYLKHSNAIEQPYCVLRAVDNFNALEIFGVPICITRISELAKNLDEKILNQAQNQETVRVFHLKFASAADIFYTYRNSEKVRIPGVVTVLREMVQSRSPAGEGTPVADQQNAGASATAAIPAFSADMQRNAVVVRDREVNMPMYENLVAQLDQPSAQIEISVAIIDVNASDINRLGRSSRLRGRCGWI